MLEFRTIGPSLNVKLNYGSNSDSRGIGDRSSNTNFSKQTLLESLYVVVYIPAYIEDFVIMNLILYLRGNPELFKVLRVILFHYKVILIKITFL